MANPNSPFGFRPLGNISGAQPQFSIGNGKIAFGNTNQLFRGDPLIRLNTGFLDKWTAGQDRGLLVGIFWSAKYLSTALGRTTQNMFWPGNDATQDATVYYIPITGTVGQLFAVQNGSSATPVSFANVGQNADVTMAAGTIAGAYGKSGVVLNQGSIANTATLPFKIEGLWSDFAPPGAPGTDNTSGFNIVVVSANSLGAAGI